MSARRRHTQDTTCVGGAVEEGAGAGPISTVQVNICVFIGVDNSTRCPVKENASSSCKSNLDFAVDQESIQCTYMINVFPPA